MRVLAVDPGGVTGLAVYDAGTDTFRSWQADSYEQVVQDVRDECLSGLTRLVVESFVIRSNTHKLDPVAFALTTDLIGACRYIAYERGVPFSKQSPAEAKSFSTDDKLRRLGWYSPTPGGHANDATRHLLRYLASIHNPTILERLTREQ